MPSKNDQLFIDNYKRLTNAQKEAVDHIDGPVLVIAGPGTGKTQLLSLRAANILSKTDTLPENILCLTFTEVGASNMRERISRFIGKQAYDINISTYHGFGNEIIKYNREYFIDFRETQPIDSISQYEIMENIYSKLTAKNALWRKDTYLKDALSAIAEIKSNNFSSEQLRIIAKDNKNTIDSLGPIISDLTSNLNMRKKESIKIFESLYIELQKFVSPKNNDIGVRALDQLLLNDLAISLIEAEEIGKTGPLTKWKNKWLQKDFKDNFVLKGKVEVEKLLSLADIYDEYQAELNKRNLHDYNDMILEAIKEMEENDELRFNLQEKYQYIMLDEFQDTNLSQLKMIDLLTNNPVLDGRPNILAVGDDDQAIYSFQGADYTNMIRFNSMYRGVKHITLQENWRSHKNIVDASSKIAEQISSRISDMEGFENKIIKSKVDIKNKSEIYRLNFKTDISEMSWISKEVSRLIKSGADASEIAVIAPKHKYLENLVPYLKNLDVPVKYEKRENILENQHILNLFEIARLIIAIGENNISESNYLWPKVLSQDHWEVDIKKIWDISWKATDSLKIQGNSEKSNWINLILKDSELSKIGYFFAKLSLMYETVSLEEMLDYISGSKPIEIAAGVSYQSPYKDYYFSKNNIRNNEYLLLLSNLTVIRQHLRDRQNSRQYLLRLKDIIDFKIAYENANEKLINTSPFASATNSVNLLTAYGSKGLEFEYVFIVGATDDIWGQRTRSKSSNISWPLNLEILKRAGQTKDEKIRLFYVALSRSKHTLYITSHSQDYSGKTKSSLEFLEEYEDNEKIISPNINHKEVVQNNDEELENINSLEAFWTDKHFTPLKDFELKEILKDRLVNYQISPTDINHFIDIINYGPESFHINKVLRFPQGSSMEATYGNIVHSTLEQSLNHFKKNKQKIDQEEVLNIFNKQLLRKKLTEEQFIQISERGSIELKNFASQWLQNFSASSFAEVDFRNEGCFIGEAHLTGKIDQIIVNQDNKEIKIIDFKTGKPHSKWTKNINMHKYRQQLLFYKFLIENSNSFKNYKLSEASLVFISPDEYGFINELRINFDHDQVSEELANLAKLITSVYRRIKELDYPDISQFNKDYNGVICFEKWLIDNH